LTSVFVYQFWKESKNEKLWSPLAIDRASEIDEYMAQDKPSDAAKWIDTVFSKAEQHKFAPEISLLGKWPYRSWIISNILPVNKKFLR